MKRASIRIDCRIPPSARLSSRKPTRSRRPHMLINKETMSGISLMRVRSAALFMALCFLPAVFAFAQDSGAKADDNTTVVADEEDLFGAEEDIGEGSAD